MAYNRENFTKLKAQYEQKNLRAKEAARARSIEVSLSHRDIAEIEKELSLTSVKILRAAAGGDSFDALKKRVEELRREKARLLLLYGYPEDYCDVRYECPDCSDTGYCESKMCKCFKKALVLLGYESSGIGALIRKQSFDNFSFDYYKDEPSTLETMKANYDILRSFAESFGEGESKNLLLMGGTGLGKTHLSSAVAKCVIERGFDVYYESAPNIFSDFEQERFTRDTEEKRTQRLFECELLIIDDLGTESVTQYTVSCLYNLINTRINKGLSTIISTNMAPNELVGKYNERITSRFMGEYLTLRFAGTDIRRQKLMK